MITAKQLREMIANVPDESPIYISAWNNAGDYVSGDVMAVIYSSEGDVVISNEEWLPSDVVLPARILSI